MSIQMTLVFSVLCVEMAILFVMVLPLPHVLRRHIVKVLDVLSNSSNFKIGTAFISIILGLQFIDCVNRLQKLDYMKNPYYTTTNMLHSEQLASKFYSQRNLYLSGAVLYLELAIFTVSTILRKMVLKQDRLRSMNVAGGSKEEEVEKFEQLIKMRQDEIDKLKKEIGEKELD